MVLIIIDTKVHKMSGYTNHHQARSKQNSSKTTPQSRSLIPVGTRDETRDDLSSLARCG